MNGNLQLPPAWMAHRSRSRKEAMNGSLRAESRVDTRAGLYIPSGHSASGPGAVLWPTRRHSINLNKRFNWLTEKPLYTESPSRLILRLCAERLRRAAIPPPDCTCSLPSQTSSTQDSSRSQTVGMKRVQHQNTAASSPPQHLEVVVVVIVINKSTTLKKPFCSHQRHMTKKKV